MVGHYFKYTLLVSLLALLPFTLASSCSKVPLTGCYICGKVENKTRWRALYTTDPHGSCSPGASCCQIRNWNNGDGDFLDAFASSPRSKNVVCTHTPLAAHTNKGGNTCNANNRVDVDAVTFADREWVISRANGVPRTLTITRGVWVKISNLETLICTERNGKPFCTSTLL
ncbi:hypothetical protein QBC43DRAFT_335961 [Cladorrhinum sp. PSN259]|nr:hypothetical protein QBC43DRAFT_335961 [Cladorrhinum sp. PSN259]